jgi:hypothetical protein
MIKWINSNKETLIRNSFLLPILLVVIMSISHVVSWYDLGNPISWAVYLSIAIEVFALASISAASIKTSKTAIWILFGIVTAIQIIGNIFYEFKDIDMNGEGFQSWIQLIDPFFIDWEPMDHRRLLAIIQGGTLPIMSLTALHFYIQFKEKQTENASSKEIEVPEKNDTPLSSPISNEPENRPTEPANFKQQESETNWDELYETLNKENSEKQEQRQLLAEMMKNDEDAGLYDTGDLLNKNKKTKDNLGGKKNINKSKNLTDMQVSKGSSRPPKNWG